MIEQFMLAANEAVATLLIGENIPCVYRVHEKPKPEKLEAFLSYASNLGLRSTAIDPLKCESKDLAILMNEAAEAGLSEPVSYACLRSMAKAEYSEINSGHFGLSIKNYCHFTSPIRRLSDLATHRIIHATLFEGKQKEKYRSLAKRAAAAATDGEIRAVTAERRIENLYKVIYMSDKVGECFLAKVSSVSSFGIFAALENTCEGLIPLSTRGPGYIYDENNLTVRTSKDTIRIGDPIKVRLEEADMTRGKLRFSILEADDEG
jgi:ribonuclease R